MSRTVLIAFALAALCVSAAKGLPDTTAKSQASTAPASASHKKARHTANHAAGHATGHAVRRTSRHESVKTSSRIHARNGDAHASSRGQLSGSRNATKTNFAAKSHPSTEKAVVDRPAAAKAVSRRKARTATPPPLRGSFESLERQNEKTEADNLERIEDDDDLADRIARQMLVPLPVSAALTVNENLTENYRYCRPWTATFSCRSGARP